MDDLNPFLEPGMYVRHPTESDWGVGQVQSSIKGKVTVNFENEMDRLGQSLIHI